MTAYLLADLTITDPSWVPAYAARVHLIVEKHGGRYLSRSGNITTLEGPPNTSSVVALIAFPSAEAARAFVEDPDYAPFAKARQAGSSGVFRVFDDTDLAGSIPYLKAASAS